MRERPILFSAPMVRAILDGTKTQTRRVVKPVGNDGGFVLCEQKDGSMWPYRSDDGESCFVTRRKHDGDYLDEVPMRCPYGQPGDRLWVRETWGFERRTEDDPLLEPVAAYRADDAEHLFPVNRWRPSIHMPRHLSRITLEVTAVRVERLQDISEADALAEGCAKNHNGYFWAGPHAVSGRKQMATAPQAYRDLWESINGPGSWDANPWVWVVEFRRAPAAMA